MQPSIFNFFCIDGRGRLKSTHAQQGMTLLEVLVSIIILTLGVLALLATQLKTVSGVREAEQQTIVAQAVQNLQKWPDALKIHKPLPRSLVRLREETYPERVPS